MTSDGRKPLRRIACGCAVAFGITSFLASGVLAYLFWTARQVPDDSPLARMYRTEADLLALKKAIETYHSLNGALPPAGPQGLELAARALSRNVDYLPLGPPLDGWEQGFFYSPTPEQEYNETRQAYALYSAGMDGIPGNQDDITNADPRRTWRTVYTKRQRQPGSP